VFLRHAFGRGERPFVTKGGDFEIVDTRPEESGTLIPAGLGQNYSEALLSFPVAVPDDLGRVYRSIAQHYPGDCPTLDALPCWIAGVVDTSGGQRYRIRFVNFGTSELAVVKVLRDELGVPAPKGHIVIRILALDRPMPAALAAFHKRSPDVAGVAFGGPYVAVFQSEVGLDDTIAHEIVHAYLRTSMGPASDQLPGWFHEGVAISLAGSMPTTAEIEPGGGLEMTTLSGNYREYRRIFSATERRLGRKRYLAVIRECIQERSEGALYRATGTSGYRGLVGYANRGLLSEVGDFLCGAGIGRFCGV